jgi:SAM-dependent methyltransferase
MAHRTAREMARYAYRIGAQFFNPLRWPAIPAELLAYVSDLRTFRRMLGTRSVSLEIEPVFFNRRLRSPFDTHYTYQAAWATRGIAARRPEVHVDVSSSVPFVAQLSAIVPVTMYEFSAPDIALAGLSVHEASVVALPLADRSVVSLSCLHVIEHVGLGRYGDPIDPDGMDKATRELCRVVAPGGALYVSFPVGRERIAFNAHRVSDAEAFVDRVAAQGLALEAFALVDDEGRFHDPAHPRDARGLSYGCGCFRFVRNT